MGLRVRGSGARPLTAAACRVLRAQENDLAKIRANRIAEMKKKAEERQVCGDGPLPMRPAPRTITPGAPAACCARSPALASTYSPPRTPVP